MCLAQKSLLQAAPLAREYPGNKSQMISVIYPLVMTNIAIDKVKFPIKKRFSIAMLNYRGVHCTYCVNSNVCLYPCIYMYVFITIFIDVSSFLPQSSLPTPLLPKGLISPSCLVKGYISRMSCEI